MEFTLKYVLVFPVSDVYEEDVTAIFRGGGGGEGGLTYVQGRLQEKWCLL